MVATQESATAKLCSFARAFHSNTEPSKIFDDQLAYDLMGQSEYNQIGQLVQNGFDDALLDPNRDFSSSAIRAVLNQYILPIPISRIAFAEQSLRDFSETHKRCQYVICGAGMDSFAFRNENPGIEVFELDHPDTQRYKLSRIKALEWNIPENVHYVPVDFNVDTLRDALLRSGFDPSVPTFTTVLGVAYYLTLPVFERTLADIGALSVEGSRLIFDYPDETTFSPSAVERVCRLCEITAALGEPMTQGFSFSTLQEALRRQSFAVEAHLKPKDIQRRYFVQRIDGLCAFENTHFISAVKKAAQPKS